MPIYYSTYDGGVFKNFQLQGYANRVNTNTSIIEQGFFEKNKLTDSVGTKTNFANVTTVTIRRGVFLNGIENGATVDYEFAKADWDLFLTYPDLGVDATKFARTYASGVLTNTASSTSQKIKGRYIYDNGKIVSFEFAEVA